MRATIKMKLGLTFGILIVMMLAIVSVGVSRMNTLNNAITDLVTGAGCTADACTIAYHFDQRRHSQRQEHGALARRSKDARLRCSGREGTHPGRRPASARGQDVRSSEFTTLERGR